MRDKPVRPDPTKRRRKAPELAPDADRSTKAPGLAAGAGAGATAAIAVCRFFGSPEGCRFGDRCRFSHVGATRPGGARRPVEPLDAGEGWGFRYNFSGAEFLDHFETPALAYEDIAPALDAVAARLRKGRAELRIFDPYFCRGSVKKHLGALGFASVHNENEDCYASARWRDHSLFDVVVTNPPYSGTHKERFMQWARTTGRPFFCLMWSFAASKQWYRDGARGQGDWFLAPASLARYDFRNPLGKGMQGGSPYPPLWFCNTSAVAPDTRAVVAALTKRAPPEVRLLTSADELAASGTVRSGKRGNPRQRAKARRRVLEDGAE